MKRWIYVFIALLVGVGMGAMFSPFSSVLVINSTKGAKAQFLSNEFNAPFGEQGKKLLAEIESTQLKNQDVLRLILAWIYVSLDVQRPSNLSLSASYSTPHRYK